MSRGRRAGVEGRGEGKEGGRGQRDDDDDDDDAVDVRCEQQGCKEGDDGGLQMVRTEWLGQWVV